MIYYSFMNNVIKIANQNFYYKITKSKKGVIRLSIGRDGSFNVSKPWFVSKRMVKSFLFEKSDWILDKFKNFVKEDFAKLNLEDNKKYQQNKKKSLNFIRERVKVLNNYYKFKFNKISVRNQKTRWGSCSKKGSLNFNYKIIFLPLDLADYIIIHELCHLKEFNHSKNFWNLVAVACPDFKEKRRNLKNFSFNELK